MGFAFRLAGLGSSSLNLDGHITAIDVIKSPTQSAICEEVLRGNNPILLCLSQKWSKNKDHFSLAANNQGVTLVIERVAGGGGID